MAWRKVFLIIVKRNFVALSVLTAVAWSSLITVAHAEFWDFNTTPIGLNYYDPFPPFGPSAIFTVPGANGTLRVQNSESAFLDGIAPGLGTARAGVYGNESYTDFTAFVDVVDWDTAVNQDAVLGARGQNVGLGTTSGYFAGFDFNASFPNFGVAFIGRADNEAITTLNFSFFSMDTTHDYRIGFQGIGSDLEAMIFDITGGMAPVASVSVTDSTYSSGTVGAFAIGIQGETTPVDITFDNLTASAVTVPEASTLGLLAIGAASVVCGITRRKRALVA